MAILDKEKFLQEHPNSIRDEQRRNKRIREKEEKGADPLPGVYTSDCSCGAVRPKRIDDDQINIGAYKCVDCCTREGEASANDLIKRLQGGELNPYTAMVQLQCACGQVRSVPTHIADAYQMKGLQFKCATCLSIAGFQ
jgi:hypothetical protein